MPLVRSLVGVALCTAGSAWGGALTITEAWIRATPPGARTAAAYLTITNTGTADRLLGGTTPLAGSFEMHTHVNEGGLLRMVRLTEVALPAGESVKLEPGGLHVMLIDVAAPLAAGARVALSLRFAVAGTREIEVPVIDARASGPTAHPTH